MLKINNKKEVFCTKIPLQGDAEEKLILSFITESGCVSRANLEQQSLSQPWQ